MKVKELIKQLEKMPQNAKVYHIWDGEPRTQINVVYLAKSGKVITSDFWEVVYTTDERPKDAPTSNERGFWKTPKK